MANQDAAFGMRPLKMIGGAPYTGGQSRYRIAANYGTAIFQGDMVAQVTGGGVEVHADGGTVPIVGVFNGVQYTDPTTKEQKFSNFYPASTNASDIIAFIIDDPNVIYEIQCNAAFPVADLFGNFDIVYTPDTELTKDNVKLQEFAGIMLEQIMARGIEEGNVLTREVKDESNN